MAKKSKKAKKSKGKGTSKRVAFSLERAFSRLLRSPGGSPGPAARQLAWTVADGPNASCPWISSTSRPANRR